MALTKTIEIAGIELAASAPIMVPIDSLHTDDRFSPRLPGESKIYSDDHIDQLVAADASRLPPCLVAKAKENPELDGVMISGDYRLLLTL